MPRRNSSVRGVKLSSQIAIATVPRIHSHCILILAVLGIAACSADQTLLTAAAAPTTCLPGERGYLRVGLRGAMDRDLDWRGAQLQCEGGARPAGNGLRMSFSGSTADPDQKLRIVFGISIRPGVHTASNLPTNITVIIEGENRLYATQGEEKCVVESLVQEA